MLRKLRIACVAPVAATVLFGWPAMASAGAQSACTGQSCHFRSDTPVVQPAVYHQCVIYQGKRICRH